MATNNNKNFIKNLQDNIYVKHDNDTLDDTINVKHESNIDNVDNKFKIKKNVDKKSDKKVFQVYIDPELLKRLDKECKRANYSRNEMVIMMIEHCLDNFEFEE